MKKQAAIPADASKVLLIMNDHHLGNTVISLPVLEAYGRYFGNRLEILIDRRYLPLAECLPSRPRLCAWPDRQRHPGGFRRSLAEARCVLSLRRKRFDISVDLMGMVRSTRITRWVAAQRRYGFGHLRNPHVYSDHVSRPSGPHCFDRYRRFLELIGTADPPRLQLSAPDVCVQSVGRQLVEAGLVPDSPLVLIHPSSAKTYRRWPIERFGEVAEGLIDSHDANICIVGTRPERDLCRQLLGAIRQRDRAVHLEPDILELLALMNRSDLLVSSESGPTHLAAATTVPIVTVFGPSDEDEWRPLRIKNLTVLRGAACDPNCHPARCLHGYRCLMDLDAGQVLEAARKAIG
ncbi:MAG: glycosyltransferase family 9 protein [Phycisphaeraceae bacterium]|nr:glycosyltransferase family 9 protein [Phycisphaeraceae bacterium]